MLKEVGPDVGPHWVKDKIYSFPACHFCGRNKIAVTGNEYYLVNLLLERHGRYIYADTHIDAFLLGEKLKIIFSKVFQAYSASK